MFASKLYFESLPGCCIILITYGTAGGRSTVTLRSFRLQLPNLRSWQRERVDDKFVLIHPVDVLDPSSEDHDCIFWIKRKLQMSVSWHSWKSLQIHPAGTLNVVAKFHVS